MDSQPFWGCFHLGLRSIIPACSSAAIRAMPPVLRAALLSSLRKGTRLYRVSDLSRWMFPLLTIKYQRINTGLYTPPLIYHQVGGGVFFCLPGGYGNFFFVPAWIPSSPPPQKKNSLLFHNHRMERRRRRMISAS